MFLDQIIFQLFNINQVFAQEQNSTNLEPTPLLQNPLGQLGGSGADIDSLEDLIVRILEIIVQIGIPVIALFIIYSGFLFVAAQGNPQKLKQAKNTLLYTLIGAAVILASTVIAKAISGTIADLAR